MSRLIPDFASKIEADRAVGLSLGDEDVWARHAPPDFAENSGDDQPVTLTEARALIADLRQSIEARAAAMAGDVYRRDLELSRGRAESAERDLQAAQKSIGALASEIDALKAAPPLPVNMQPATLAEAKASLAALNSKIEERARILAKEMQAEDTAALTSLAETAEHDLQEALARIKKLEAIDPGAESVRQIQELNSQVESITKERDQVRGELDTANLNLDRLEGLCGVRGVSPSQVPKALTEPLPSMDAGQFQTRLANTRDPEERAKIRAEFSEAVKNGRVKPS